MEGDDTKSTKVSTEPEGGTAQATPGMKVAAAPATKSNTLYSESPDVGGNGGR
jgi:hypothetical protein